MASADFGAAYLTQRWASRFLSELFRRFAVLFVGYSVEDPVVRYMMDAFAADRALGEGVRKAFVLAGCSRTIRETTRPYPTSSKSKWCRSAKIPLV